MEHLGLRGTVFTNHGPAPIEWKAAFGQTGAGKGARITIDDASAPVLVETRQNRVLTASAIATVQPGESRRAIRSA